MYMASLSYARLPLNVAAQSLMLNIELFIWLTCDCNGYITVNGLPGFNTHQHLADA